MGRNNPDFRRYEGWRYKRLGDKWRRPRGKDSKTRISKKGKPALVKIGYGSPRSNRHLHPSGYREALIHNVDELKDLDSGKVAVRIAGSVGRKKRKAIKKVAKEMGFKVLN